MRSLPVRWSRAALLAVVALFALAAAPGIAPGTASAANPVTPWRLMTAPTLSSSSNHLQEVSCVSNTRCVAVGFLGDLPQVRRPLVQTLNGGTWQAAVIPSRGTSDNTLWNVSCVSTTHCVAVGYYYNIGAGYYKTLIATLNGSTWSLTPSPNRANTHNFLFGVDCVSATRCVAVGRTATQTDPPVPAKNLVLTLDGTQWKMPAVPNRANSDNRLSDVSCADATHCKAVGYSTEIADDALVRTMVLSYDSGTWSIDESADRAGVDNLLRDVDCPTASTCVAVGASDPSRDEGVYDEVSLIESLSGGTWSVAATTDRPGLDNHLWAVSCSNAQNCVAAGQSQNDTSGRNLIQTLAAGTWSLTSPAPYRSNTFNFLYGLSCPTYRNCKAVGDYFNRAGNRYLAAALTNSPA